MTIPIVGRKLLFTRLRRLKNTSKLFKYSSAVNCWILLEPAAVNYQGKPRQLTADAILLQIWPNWSSLIHYYSHFTSTYSYVGNSCLIEFLNSLKLNIFISSQWVNTLFKVEPGHELWLKKKIIYNNYQKKYIYNIIALKALSTKKNGYHGWLTFQQWQPHPYVGVTWHTSWQQNKDIIKMKKQS